MSVHNVMQGVARRLRLFTDCAPRIAHFARRSVERARDGDPLHHVVVVLDVDDPYGKQLTEQVYPGHEACWVAFRARGQIPLAVGLVEIDGVAAYVRRAFSDEAARDLLATPETEIAVVVISAGNVLISRRTRPTLGAAPPETGLRVYEYRHAGVEVWALATDEHELTALLQGEEFRDLGEAASSIAHWRRLDPSEPLTLCEAPDLPPRTRTVREWLVEYGKTPGCLARREVDE